jgi:hypothetical protein
LEVFKEHTVHDKESFEALEDRLEHLDSTLIERFDKLDQLVTDIRIHTARREGGEDAIKRVAGYISGIVAAAVSALGVLFSKLFLE